MRAWYNGGAEVWVYADKGNVILLSFETSLPLNFTSISEPPAADTKLNTKQFTVRRLHLSLHLSDTLSIADY